MVPSLMPARSAPMGVSVVLSCFASSGETASAGGPEAVIRASHAAEKSALSKQRLFRRGSWGSVVEFAEEKRRYAMRPRPSMLWLTVARAACAALSVAVAAWAFPGSPSLAADLYHDDTLDVRWDNTLSYTAAFRLFPRDPALVANPNWDDGDRNFRPGVISNRLDLLSELEVTAGDWG